MFRKNTFILFKILMENLFKAFNNVSKIEKNLTPKKLVDNNSLLFYLIANNNADIFLFSII